MPYQLSVHTGDVSGAGTDANVFVVLYGDQGKSDTYWLRSKTDNFERNEVDMFKVQRFLDSDVWVCRCLLCGLTLLSFITYFKSRKLWQHFVQLFSSLKIKSKWAQI